MPIRSVLTTTLMATLVLTACGSGTVAPTAPSDLSVPAASVTTAAVAAVATTASTSTTVAASMERVANTAVATVPPTVTVPAGSPMLSPDGPWTLVESAPGITSVGLVYELMPKLWVFLPTQEDRPNGYFWTFNELDRPAIEGYIKAMLTRYRSTDSVPATLDDEGWDLYYTHESSAEIVPKYQAIADAGEYTDLDLGVVLRPTVLEDNRTETYTIVLDCVVDGAVRRNADGSYAASATPGIGDMGYAAGMELIDGSWRVGGYSKSDDGCVLR